MDNVRRLSSKYILAVWLTIFILFLAIGLNLFLRTQRRNIPPDTHERITIAYSATINAVLPEVALMQGFFIKEGLEVIPHTFAYGKPALDDVLEGNADFATVAETPIMFSIMNGAKISIVATIQTSTRDNAIIARKDKGIFTPGDLNGKKIGVTLGTTGEFFLDVFLTLHGISRNEIKLVDMNGGELLDGLTEGKVDAITTFNPFLIYAQKKFGKRVITFYDEEIYLYIFNVVTTQEFIHKNPAKVKKMLRALIKADEFTRQNPEIAQKNVADFSHFDLSLVREIWDNYKFGVSLDQSLILALEDESRWAIKGGFVDSKIIPNYLDYIYFDGLMSIKPDAVRILR